MICSMLRSVLLGHCVSGLNHRPCVVSQGCALFLLFELNWTVMDMEHLSLFSFRTETSSLMFLTFLMNIRPYKPPFAQTMVLTPSMPAHRRQMVSLVYNLSSRIAKATQRKPVP